MRCFPSGGNFVLVYFGPRAKEIVGALTRKGMLVRDRSSDFGGEGYVRITLGHARADAASAARTGVHPMRKANLRRKTKETDIRLRLNLDGRGKSHIATGVRFFDHMLEQIARHGGLDMDLAARGDLDVDQHHTVEDVGIALGRRREEGARFEARNSARGIFPDADGRLPRGRGARFFRPRVLRVQFQNFGGRAWAIFKRS